MYNSNIHWIFFDLDDTLWNFTDNSSKSLVKLYEVSPILRKLFHDPNEFIEIYHEHNAHMWHLYSLGEVTTSQLKLERWRRTLSTRQFEVLTAVCEELDRLYLEILAQGKETISGVDKMLEKLSKNFLIAVLSNGFSDTQYKKLFNSGLDKFITRTIVSEEIGINKPNPQIFDYAVSETGATSPLLMIGDNFNTDILGAMNAGWNAIWFNPLNKPIPLTEDEIRDLNINPKLLRAVVNNSKDLEEAIYQIFK